MGEITRRNRGQPMTFREAMNRFMEEPGWWMTPTTEWANTFPLDMYETDNDYVIKVSTPGIRPEDLDVNVSNNVLTIRGELREEEKREETRYHYMERRYGTFERSVVLPTSVDVNQVHANLNNGILTVTIPKTEEAKPHRINVQVTAGGQQQLQTGRKK